MPTAAQPARSPGRPRRFDPDTEVRLILEAAQKLLRENDYEDVSVGAILDESGLSTRSFYRHFSAKDELLIAMYRTNASQLAEIISGLVAAAPDPGAGLEAWVDGMLRLRFHAPTARRVAMLGSPSARRAAGYAGAERDARAMLVHPLLDVLRAGHSDGSMPLTRPEADARTIYTVTLDVMRWDAPELTVGHAREHILRFAFRGVGGTEPAAEGTHPVT